MSENAQQLSLTEIAEVPEFTPLGEQEISVEVLIEKYAKGAGLSVPDVRRRVIRRWRRTKGKGPHKMGKSASSGRRRTASFRPAGSTPPARRWRPR